MAVGTFRRLMLEHYEVRRLEKNWVRMTDSHLRYYVDVSFWLNCSVVYRSISLYSLLEEWVSMIRERITDSVGASCFLPHVEAYNNDDKQETKENICERWSRSRAGAMKTAKDEVYEIVPFRGKLVGVCLPVQYGHMKINVKFHLTWSVHRHNFRTLTTAFCFEERVKILQHIKALCTKSIWARTGIFSGGVCFRAFSSWVS